MFSAWYSARESNRPPLAKFVGECFPCKITGIQPPREGSYLVSARCNLLPESEGPNWTPHSYWMTLQIFLSAPGEPTSVQ
jgi:hypothetical protein